MATTTFTSRRLSVGVVGSGIRIRHPLWTASRRRVPSRSNDNRCPWKSTTALPLLWVRGGHAAAVPPAAPHDDHDDDDEAPYRVYLAVGSNLGNRFDNIRRALQLLCQDDNDDDDDNNNDNGASSSSSTTTRLVRTSFLHETPPMYVTDQPAFVNGAVQLATHLAPHQLLQRCKHIEQQLGRSLDSATTALRYGPRPVDLDILLVERRVEAGGQWFRREIVGHGDEEDKDEADTTTTTLPPLDLIIPHPRMQERHFVLQPLLEVAGPNVVHPVLHATIGELHQRLQQQQQPPPDQQPDQPPPAVRVLPLPRNRFLYWNETLVMGILNVTPDSFSDGGLYYHDDDDDDAVDAAAQHALHLVRHDGATVVDIGGESTRPGATPVTVAQELQRTVPVIARVRALSDNVVISIDTRRAAVARAAVHAGADIVNDVSGGTYDPAMLTTVAELGVPLVLMHMRGTPQTMQHLTAYDDPVMTNVAKALVQRSRAAERAGIPRWLQVVDPGIGFAKDLEGNLALLRNLAHLRQATGGLPILLGTSRKGFLGTLADIPVAADRDYATVASCVAALCLEPGQPAGSVTPAATMLRVHNPAAMVQAVKVMKAIREESSSSGNVP